VLSGWVGGVGVRGRQCLIGWSLLLAPVLNQGSLFGAGIPDQAVKSLAEIWRPNDIPRVFLATVKGARISHSPSIQQVLVLSGSETDQNNLLPLRTFVHEVLFQDSLKRRGFVVYIGQALESREETQVNV